MFKCISYISLCSRALMETGFNSGEQHQQRPSTAPLPLHLPSTSNTADDAHTALAHPLPRLRFSSSYASSSLTSRRSHPESHNALSNALIQLSSPRALHQHQDVRPLFSCPSLPH